LRHFPKNSPSKTLEMNIEQTTNNFSDSDYILLMAKKLLAGGVAGIVGTTCIYPIDLVKTRLQNEHSRVGISKLPSFIKQIYSKNGGLKGFYAGLSANLLGVTPEKAIKLTVNDLARMELAKWNGVNEKDLGILWGVVAGGVAGACQIIATTPMEMAKIQLQMLSKQHPESIATTGLIKIVKSLGITGLYRGFGATFARDVPFSIVFFPTHAFFKNQIFQKDDSLLAGFGAGALAALFVTPMDVVKTRLQTLNDPQIKMSTIYREIYREEGLKAFFKGSLQRCFIVASLFGISLKVYELIK
jgi:hypothetical protein